VERSSQGGTFEQALGDILRIDYARFERDLGDYLSAKFGS